MFRAVLVAVALCLATLSVQATEILQITKGPDTRWAVGDKSQAVLTSDGRLSVQLTVKKSPTSGQSYYVLSFESRSGDPVNFSARVSDRPPQRTHFAARAEPGRPYQWGEHLPADLGTVYVMYRPSK
ncbi:MAG: hypothetical protein ACXW2D_15945 [Burkholderiaceae bacterium]